jgi:hypothetical protein
VGALNVAPSLVIESAHYCSGDGTCEEIPHPKEVWLEIGHAHEVNVSVPEGADIRSRVSNPDVVQYSDSYDEHAGGSTGTGAAVSFKARSLGQARVDVELEGVKSGPTASLEIRTVTPRVTVVGWVNGPAIDLKTVAPRPSDTVKTQFRNIDDVRSNRKARRGCISAMAELLGAWISPGTQLPFVSEKSPYDDAVYAGAALVKSSANHTPPPKLTDDYIRGGDYRLLNDFQVLGGADRAFAQVTASRAIVGRTPLPCGGEEVIRKSRLASMVTNWLDLGTSDAHEQMNNRRFCNARTGHITQISEGRIGRMGREVQKILTGSTRRADDIVPWIYSAVSFNRNAVLSLQTQAFPTYFVYIDGRLDRNRTVKQGKYADFVSRDATSQFSANGIDFDTNRGKCP